MPSPEHRKLFATRGQLTKEYFEKHKGQGKTMKEAAAAVSADPRWKKALAEYHEKAAKKAATTKKAAPAKKAAARKH